MPGHYVWSVPLIRLFVLDAICDDYENVDQVILRHVAGYCAKLGMAVYRSDVVKASHQLVESGMAQAYRLSSTEPFKKYIEGIPPLDVVETYFKTYFYITKKGMERHLSDDGWPFDEDGEPLV